jgi:hypothetical protein
MKPEQVAAKLKDLRLAAQEQQKKVAQDQKPPPTPAVPSQAPIQGKPGSPSGPAVKKERVGPEKTAEAEPEQLATATAVARSKVCSTASRSRE